MKFAPQLITLALVSSTGWISSLAAAEVEMPVEVTRSETLPLSPDGTIRVDRTWGDVSVEAWDKPAVEVVMTAASKRPYSEADAAEARGRLERFGFDAKAASPGEVIVTGVSPKAGLLRPFDGKSGVAVRYAIKVPRTSDLTLRHEVGVVEVTGVEGNVDVNTGTGEVTLKVPLGPDVAVETSSKVGDAALVADLLARGTLKRPSLVGHSFRYQPPALGRHIRAHVGIGTVTIN